MAIIPRNPDVNASGATESILERLGFGFQLPADAEYGPAAYPSLLRRLGSALMLVSVSVLIGLLVTAVFGAIVLIAIFLLEQAISS